MTDEQASPSAALVSTTENLHEAYARFYLPRLRRWGRGGSGNGSSSSEEDDDRITALDLEGRDVTDADCLRLADALRENGTLTYLSIAHNPMVSSVGVAAIAEAVGGHPTLREWRLADGGGPTRRFGSGGGAERGGADADDDPDADDDGGADGNDKCGRRVVVDAAVSWVPLEWQGRSDPLPEAALTQTPTTGIAAVAATFAAVRNAVLASETLSRVTMPAPPRCGMLCGITDSVFDPEDPSSHFGNPAAVETKFALERALRAAARSADEAIASARLNSVISRGGSCWPNWKRCLIACLEGSSAVDDASHNLSLEASISGTTSKKNQLHPLSGRPQQAAARLRRAISVISGAIGYSNFVRRVDLSGFGTAFGDAAIARLDLLLLSAPRNCVSELCLARNDLTSAGALAIFARLRANGGNASLTELDLSANRIADHALHDLLDLAKHQGVSGKPNVALSYVHLDGNCVSPALAAQVLQRMALNAQPVRFKETLLHLEEDNVAATRAVFNQQAHAVRLNDVSCRLLLQALRSNTRITHVDVSCNDITDDGAVYLAEIVASNKTLKRLLARSNHITDQGAAAILAAIPRNPSIEQVDLDDQHPPAGVSAALLDRIRWLAALNSHPAEIKSKGLLLLQNDPSLTEIRIASYDGQRRLTEGAIDVLCEMLAANVCVTSLTIANHPPSEHVRVDQTIPRIATLAAPKLTSLDLSGNALTDATAWENISRMMHDPAWGAASLRRLILARNAFSAQAALETAEIVRGRNAMLVEVDFSANPGIGAGELEAVDFATKLNRYDASFKRLVLDVERNRSDLKDIKLVQVERTTPFGTSHHFVARYDDVAAELLGEALSQNSHVTCVNLSGNAIGDRGAAALGEMLKLNTSVTALHLSANDMTDRGLQSLAGALLENHQVRILTYDGNRQLRDMAVQKSLNLSLAQNTQSADGAAASSHGGGGPRTAGIYSASVSGKRAKMLKAADQDKILDAAILDDAMADYHAAARRREVEAKRRAEAERQRQEDELRASHEAQLQQQHHHHHHQQHQQQPQQQEEPSGSAATTTTAQE